MPHEYFWFLVPINALLWQIGGTWCKAIRRFGFPTLVLSCVLWATGSLPRACASSFLAYFSTTLPFTIGGSSVKAWWQFLWIWIAGFILGTYILVLDPGRWYLAFIPCDVQGVSGTLSNVPATAKAFPWKLCEALIGAAAITPLCFFLAR